MPLWQPGPRLAGRVTESQATARPAGRDPRWLAAAILIAALAIAVSLWLAALWLQSNQTPDDELPEEDQTALSTLFSVETWEQHA